MSGWVDPMLATLASDLPTDSGWRFERKLDGIRCLAYRVGDRVQLFTRNRNPIDAPDVAAALLDHSVAAFIVDGELVNGHFGPDDPRGFHVFDVLSVSGESTLQASLEQRLPLLDLVIEPGGPVHLVDELEAAPETLLSGARQEGWEGVVAKRLDSTYTPGRSRQWLKVKATSRQELVIGGFTAGKGGRTGFGAVLVGHFDGGELRYAGKVGTGFTDDLLRSLRRSLDERVVSDSPFVDAPRMRDVTWVRPELVAEVEFLSWTGEGRLRHPSFRGLRVDKPAAEVRRE